jgi:GTPase involved in cell partitioning and DNA repair
MKSHYKKRPDGGHGGQGGYVILVADENEQSLNMQRHHFQAQDGKHGSSQQLHGRNGKDLIIRVPRGVVVKKVQDAWGEDNVYSILQQDDDNHDDDLIVYPETFNKDSWTKATQGKRDELLLSKEEETEEDLITSQTNITEVIDDDDVKSSQATRVAGMSLRAQRRRRRTLKKTPHDYDDIVNTGEKSAEDGMYYWSPMERQSALDDDDREIKSNNMNPEDDTEDNDVQWEEKRVEVIADLDQAGSFVIVAHGGKGGIGNSIYASRQFSDQHSSKAAKKAVGQVGETTYLELELKLIADIGLVGFPNAGELL